MGRLVLRENKTLEHMAVHSWVPPDIHLEEEKIYRRGFPPFKRQPLLRQCIRVEEREGISSDCSPNIKS